MYSRLLFTDVEKISNIREYMTFDKIEDDRLAEVGNL